MQTDFVRKLLNDIAIVFTFDRFIAGQLFLIFFAPWAPKSQNDFHGPLKSFYALLADLLIRIKEV